MKVAQLWYGKLKVAVPERRAAEILSNRTTTLTEKLRLIRELNKVRRGRPSKAFISLRAALAVEQALKSETGRQKQAARAWDEARRQDFQVQFLAKLGFGRMTPKHLLRVINNTKKANADQMADIDLWGRWQRGLPLSRGEQRRIERELLSES